MSDLEDRVAKLEHIMYGNGEKGALEILRNTHDEVKEMKPQIESIKSQMIKLGGVGLGVMAAINIVLKFV